MTRPRSKYLITFLASTAVWISFSNFSWAQLYNLGAFWRVPGPYQLAVSTAPQSLNANQCSAITTAQTQYKGGAPYKVNSNFTVNLNGNGFLFFSDAACTTPIWTVTIPAQQTTSAGFYFIAQATNPILVSGSKIISGTQTETIAAGSAITGFGYINSSYTNGSADFTGAASSFGNMAVYNNKLYATFASSGGGDAPFQFVYVYNGNDAAPSWSQAGGSLPYVSGYMYYAPQLTAYAGALFAIWVEQAAGHLQVRAKQYNGTTWSAADSGSLNVNTGEDAEYPIMSVYAGNLYAAWDENGLVHVAQYGGGTTWTRIDDNGSGGTTGTSMNYASDGTSNQASIWGTAQGMFVAWGNTHSQVRVKLFNGTSWAAADSGSGIQANNINGNFQFHVINFATINGKTYAAWYDGGYQGRVAVFAGGTTWNFVDGGTGLFDQTPEGGSTIPTLLAYQDRLYAVWSEGDSTSNISYPSEQVRVDLYNGNDGAPVWTTLGTPGTDGMGYVPWPPGGVPGYSGFSGATVFNNKMYSGFWDSQGLDTAVFTQSTTPAKLWLPSVDFNDKENYQTVDCTPDEVRAADSSGRPTYVTSPTVVTLTGTGIAFFADDYCSIPLTSNQVTINTGDSGAHFFFLVQSGGDVFSIGASGGGLTAATQSLNNGDSIWVGGASCDQNWTTAACWSGNTVPGYDGTAIFSGSQCTVHCNATINTSNLQNLQNIFLEGDYTGTVTQGAGTTPSISGTLQIEGGIFQASTSSSDTFSPDFIFLGGTGVFNSGTGTINAGLEVDGGTFNANTATVNLRFLIQTAGQFNGVTAALSENGDFTMTGGTFNAPSGTMYMCNDGCVVTGTGSPTFNTDGGTVIFNPNGAKTVIASGPIAFNNVTFAGVTGTWWAPISIHGPMIITGNLVMNNDTTGLGGRFVADDNTGVLEVSGNVTGNSGTPDYYGESTANYTTLELVGSGSQTVSESMDCLPGNIVVASSGNVTFTGNIYAYGWTYTSGNVIDSGTTVLFYQNSWGVWDINSGAMHFNNVVIASSTANNPYVTLDTTTYIDGSLTDYTQHGIAGGTISLAGNFTLATQGGGGGSSGITFTGGNAQTFTNNGGQIPQGDIIVNKTPGSTLTLENQMNDGGNFTVTSGTVNLNGNLLTVQNDVTINDTITSIGGNITLGGSWTNNGTFLHGGGTVTFTNSSGENPATIGGGVPTTFYDLLISGGNAVQQNTNVSTLNFGMTSGSYNGGSSTLTVGANFSNKGAFTAGTGSVVLTSGQSHTFIGNSTTFYNLTMDDSGNSAADGVVFVSNKTYTVTNLLTLKGNATNNLALRSSIAGTQWKVNPTSYAIADVDVEDSNNTNAATIAAGTGSQDSGNNTKWSFVTDDIWIGGGGCDGNWTTPGCWSAGVPTPSSVVDFNSTCTAPCSATINASISVHALYLDSNYTGTVTQASGKSVTVASEFNIGKGTFTASSTPGDTISAGSIVVDGGTLNGQSTTFNVAGNWVFGGGTFNAQTSTVVFAPGASHNIYGTETFNNLTMDDSGNAAADTLNFGATFTMTVSGTLTLKGNATNNLLLRSTLFGSQWKINASGAHAISAVGVQDSNNTGAAAINVAAGSMDSGDNLKWTFGGVSQVEAIAGTFSSHIATSTFGTATTAGELIVVTVMTAEDNCVPTGITDSGAGSYSVAFSGSVGPHLAAAVYYRQNAPAGITSVSVTECATSTAGRTVAGHYKGLATSGVLDVFSSPNSSGTTLASWTSGTVTTSTQPELIIGAAYAHYQGGGGGNCTMAVNGLWGQDVMVNDGGVDGANGGAMLFGHEIVTTVQPSAAFTGTTTCPAFTTYPFIVTFQ